MVGKFGGAMARNDLGQDLLLHKLPRPIAAGTLLVGEKFFDFVVIERVHFVPIWLMRASLAVALREYNGRDPLVNPFNDLYELRG
jgi:hypothetical protein